MLRIKETKSETQKQQAENRMGAKKLKESSMETKPSKMMIQTH